MITYSKDIYLHNISIKLASNDRALTERFSKQLQFPKFRKYPDYIEIKIDIRVSYSPQEGERGDIFETADNNFSLNCWLRNISVKIDKKTNSIYARVLFPNALEEEALFHLLIIEPLRYLLKLRNTFFLHSAAMKKLDTGLLICGGPSAGKSTLAASLLTRGYEFLSDEFSILSKGSVYSFPLRIKLDKFGPAQKNKLKFFESRKGKTGPAVSELKPKRIAECFKPKLTLFIFKARSKVKNIGIRQLSQEESFMFLVSDKNNSLAYEKNPALRKKQIQALSFIAQTTKSYALSYRLDQLNQTCKIIDRII